MIATFGSSDIIVIFCYFDYYPNTIKIDDALVNNQIPFFGGDLTFSQYWWIVPRGLYPDKPYTYGAIILSDLIYPGFAQQGHTVGLGGPIMAYADFGIPGVLASAFLDPAIYVGALLLGTVCREYVVGGAPALLQRPALMVVLIYLFNPAALLYLSFPLNVIYLLIILGVAMI